MKPKDLAIHVKALTSAGEWVFLRQVKIPTGRHVLTLSQLLQIIIEDEIERRQQPVQNNQRRSPAELQFLLSLGGVRVPLQGMLTHPPSISDILQNVALAISQPLLLVFLNEKPWRDWNEARELSDGSEVWFAHAVGLVAR